VLKEFVWMINQLTHNFINFNIYIYIYTHTYIHTYILQSVVEKAIKEMRNRKVTGDDDVPGDVLKLLGEGGLKILKN